MTPEIRPPPVPRSRVSAPDWLSGVPATIKVLAVVVPTAFGFAGAAGGAALALDDLSTDAETASVVESHNARPLTVDAKDSPHPAIAAALAEQKASVTSLTSKIDDAIKEQRLANRIVFENQASFLAAEIEEDKRRAAAAATHARSVYRGALKRGYTPVEAYQEAIDSRPPWRR